MKAPAGRSAKDARAHHTTIIKRSSKKHHALHTGAWKVAFADFTLAMMALFMVLWIVNSVTSEERREIMALLNGQSIFDGNPFSPISSLNNIPQRPMTRSQPTAPDSPTTIPQRRPQQYQSPQLSLNDALENSRREMEELAKIIEAVTKPLDTGSNLDIEIVPQGLRLLIHDDGSREMFQRGSARLSPFLHDLLTKLGQPLNNMDNPVIISGHTDAVPYRRRQDNYNNWNLSGDRALEARRVLENGGLEERKILQVSSMASQMPLDPDDPFSATNRRIEILVLTKSAAESLYQFYSKDSITAPMPEGESSASEAVPAPATSTSPLPGPRPGPTFPGGPSFPNR